MAKSSVAHAAFRAWKAADKRRNNAAIGRAIGASGEAVGLWLGGAIPGEPFRALLADLLGDPLIAYEDSWMTEAQKDRAAKARQKARARLDAARPSLGAAS